MKPNLLDRAIGYFAPGAAARRIKNRTAIDILTRGYDGANRSRLNAGWRTGASSADAEIASAGSLLRERMRDLVRNNPHAANAVSVLVTHVIGSGIMPRAKTGNARKDKKINKLFDRHARKCDADGQLDFYGIQALTFREMVESGDGIIRRRRRKMEDKLPVPVQYQVVETDLLDATKDGPTIDGRYAVQGVEFDAIGQRTAYWMFANHPGSSNLIPGAGLTSKAIPSTEIAHLYRKDRTQVRGTPWGSPVIASLRDLGTYEEAELIRKKLEACMVGVVLNGEDNDIGIPLQGEEALEPGVYDADGVLVERFEPGMFVHARGGKDIKFNQPAQTGNYEQYKRASLHTIAAGFSVPYMLLSHDLSGGNYASSKLGLEPFKRVCEAVQWNFVIPMICQPMWDWFCEAAFLAGLIDSPEIDVEWNTPRMYSADPEKDARATVIEIRAGLKTLPEAIAERGRNPTEVLDEIQASNKALDDRDLKLESDPRYLSANGQSQLLSEEPEPPPKSGAAT